MSDTAGPAIVRRVDEGERITVGGVEHLFQLVGADTAGRLALERFTLAPGAMGARAHIHHGHDEYFCVLGGALTVHTGAGGEVVVEAGGVVAALRGAPHGFRNAGPAAVTGLCFFTPAGYEDYFREVHAAIADGADPSDETFLTGLRARYHSEPYRAD